MSIHRWLNWPKRAARILSPGDKVLVSAASQAPVPEDGKMNTCPLAVLKTLFRSCNTLVESSGNFDERWSSIATIIARCTRSGTLVGPGTNRKFRPAMRDRITLSSWRLDSTQKGGPPPCRLMLLVPCSVQVIVYIARRITVPFIGFQVTGAK